MTFFEKQINLFIAKFLFFFIKVIRLFTRKDTYILFDNLYEKDAELIDTYVLFERMFSLNFNVYYVIWKENRKYDELKKANKLKNVIVLKNSVKYWGPWNNELLYKIFFLLFRTKIVLTSFGEINIGLLNFLKKNKSITYVYMGHGIVFLKTFMFKIGYESINKYDKKIVSCPSEYYIYTKYNYKFDNLIKSVFPRYELLSNLADDNNKIIFVMFTWRTSFSNSNIKKYGKSIDESIYVKSLEQFFYNDKLKLLLKKYNITLCYTYHHALLNQTKFNKLNIDNFKYINSHEVSLYIKKSHMLITDYSSLFSDFYFLNKPVIFYLLDFFDNNLLDIDMSDMQYTFSKKNYIPNIITSIDNVLLTIEKYALSDFKVDESEKKIMDSFFYYKTNIVNKCIEEIRRI